MSLGSYCLPLNDKCIFMDPTEKICGVDKRNVTHRPCPKGKFKIEIYDGLNWKEWRGYETEENEL